MTKTLNGKWEKLDDSTFGASVRCGGHGAEHIGSTVTLVSKAGAATLVTLTEIVQDYGAGDVCIYRCDRTAVRS